MFDTINLMYFAQMKQLWILILLLLLHTSHSIEEDLTSYTLWLKVQWPVLILARLFRQQPVDVQGGRPFLIAEIYILFTKILLKIIFFWGNCIIFLRSGLYNSVQRSDRAIKYVPFSCSRIFFLTMVEQEFFFAKFCFENIFKKKTCA